MYSAGNIHPILSARWSPRAFDDTYVLNDAALGRIMEAAISAPSCNNSQPWRYIVGRRPDAVFEALLGCLSRGNRRWAKSASALIGVVTRIRGDNGEDLPWAIYDTGQSVAYLTFQLYAEGLYGRQIAGFDDARMRSIFAVPVGYVPCIVTAVGSLLEAGASAIPVAHDDEPLRCRNEVRDMVFDAASTSWWKLPTNGGGTALTLDDHPTKIDGVSNSHR